MQHIAIMRKSWGLTQKIQDGRKTIESRWYKNRSVPWNEIAAGDIVYFKNSGEPVMLAATASRILRFSNLTPEKVHALLESYGAADGLDASDIPQFYNRFKDKRYCLLIFLSDVHAVTPFRISKRGYGSMAAWLAAPSVRQLQIEP